ncbi:hypothetical protein [Streptomyces sp. NPDC008150]|uniref:hypothetical protein n=1 Tax=Streptomyces sp. NPDC008150 TaxID=3364816 RepID=UPI0036E16A0C
MDSAWTVVGTAIVSLGSLIGVVFTARNSRAAAEEQAAPQVHASERQQDREAFQAIQQGLQSQINDLREEMGRLKRDMDKLRDERDDREQKLRMALDIVRTANRRLTACTCGQEPVSIPAELIGWSII